MYWMDTNGADFLRLLAWNSTGGLISPSPIVALVKSSYAMVAEKALIKIKELVQGRSAGWIAA